MSNHTYENSTVYEGGGMEAINPMPVAEPQVLMTLQAPRWERDGQQMRLTQDLRMGWDALRPFNRSDKLEIERWIDLEGRVPV